MGVPNTTTFSLADVVAAVDPTTNDLIDCFSDAYSPAFNTTYAENKNQLDDFRDYGNSVASQTLITIANNNYKSGNVCSATRAYNIWKNGNPAIVENNNKFWFDNLGTPGSPFNGSPSDPDLEWYGHGEGVNALKFQLTSLGQAYNVTSCELPSNVLSDVMYLTAFETYSTPVDMYYNSVIGDAANLTSGDIIYTDANLTTPLGLHTGYGNARYYFQTASAATTTLCSNTPTISQISLTSAGVGVIGWYSCGILIQ